MVFLVMFITFLVIYTIFFFVEKDVEDYKFSKASDLEVLTSLRNNINGRIVMYGHRPYQLKIGDMPKITTSTMRLYGFKYHIEGVCLVPFWWKSPKIINQVYKKEKKKYLRKCKEDDYTSVKRRLGIQ